jgi:N-glycosylase/DNA lyase
MNQSLWLTHNRIENAVVKVCEYINSQRPEVKDWRDYSENQLWFELVSCILGSRVRYETAKACTIHLQNADLLRIARILIEPRSMENKIKRELNKSIYPPFSNGMGSKYRYPKSKSQYIIRTGIQIYKNDKATIKDVLRKCLDGEEARDVLVKKCAGIGLKQASLFLRNISFADSLAILDCHVIRYLELLGLSGKSDSMSQDRTHSYFTYENALKLYAISKKKTLATLDIAIWTVMRLVGKEVVTSQS